MTERPSIFDYDDYRVYLKDLYLFKKSQSRAFSYRGLSRLVGLKSSNFLKLVMDGQRHLGQSTVNGLAKVFKMNAVEKKYFDCLVRYGRAENMTEKSETYERLLQLRLLQKVGMLEADQYRFFSRWYLVALRELILLPDFREEISWINRKLNLSLTRSELDEAFETLLNLGLVERTSEGRLSPVDRSVSTSPEIVSMALFNFHREMIRKAEEALDKTPTRHRDMSGLTVSVSKATYEKLKERISEFRRELHVMLSQDKAPEAVYQVNLQVFNLSEVPWN